jgi:hypothetical protein
MIKVTVGSSFENAAVQLTYAQFIFCKSFMASILTIMTLRQQSPQAKMKEEAKKNFIVSRCSSSV